MRQNKTFDGFKLTDVIKLVESMGAEVRDGKRHQKVLTCPGTIPCAVGPTTGFDEHIRPWICRNFPSYTKQQIYAQLGRGYA